MRIMSQIFAKKSLLKLKVLRTFESSIINRLKMLIFGKNYQVLINLAAHYFSVCVFALIVLNVKQFITIKDRFSNYAL